MNIDDLKADLEKGDMVYKGACHDCQKEVAVKAVVTETGAIHIEGGAVYKVKQGSESVYLLKCDECFENDRVLRNYQKMEVYSRVVGYLRPVSQWNKGKQEEYKLRVEFRNPTGRPEDMGGR